FGAPFHKLFGSSVSTAMPLRWRVRRGRFFVHPSSLQTKKSPADRPGISSQHGRCYSVPSAAAAFFAARVAAAFFAAAERAAFLASSSSAAGAADFLEGAFLSAVAFFSAGAFLV